MKILRFCLIFLLIWLFPVTALAFEFKTTTQGSPNYILAADEEIDDTLVVVAREVEIAGQVNGDAFILAQKAEISGSIRGNLAVTAVETTLGGEVTGDAFILARFAHLTSQAQIGRDLVVLATNIQKSDQLKIGRKSYFLPLLGKKEVFSARTAILKVIFNTIVLAILGALLLWLLRRPFDLAVEAIRTRPLKSFLVGLAAFLVSPLLIMILLLSIIGWATATILAVLLWVALFSAPLVVGFIVGEFLLKAKQPALISLIVGVVIYQIIVLIPYLGPVLAFGALLMGLGGGLTAIYRIGKAS